VAARYSDRLFADLLVVLLDGHDNQATLDQALAIAGRDGSRLYGLCPASEGAAPNTTLFSDLNLQNTSQTGLKSWFEEQCRAAGVEGRLASQAGEVVETICQRAALADLIVYGRPTKDPNSAAATEQLLSLIRQSPRPVLISTDPPAPLDNVLLAYDGGQKSKEALFAAAYMAERWGVSLTVVLAPEAGIVEDTDVDHARRYLEMHEVEAAYVVCGADPIGLILDTATEKAVQLIIAGGYSERRFGRLGPGDVVNRLITAWQGALLICP
jgi:nucleotide-binding universal stress UspA family protein